MGYLARENGKHIYYEDYGHGNAALILIHGWGMGVRTWDYTLPRLAGAGKRIVLLDHRGCGQSDKDFADMGVQAIADDVVALIDALGLTKVVLNGWSLGGAVAVEAAHQLGDACAGLVLTCAATPCYLQKDGFPHGGTEDALAETLAAMAADRVNFLSGLAAGICAAEVSDTVIEWMREIFMQASPLAAQALGELGPLDQRSILAELSMPILSFVGANDSVVDPNVCRSIADYNNGTVLVECEASGHAPFIEEPDLYHEHLTAFIDAHL